MLGCFLTFIDHIGRAMIPAHLERVNRTSHLTVYANLSLTEYRIPGIIAGGAVRAVLEMAGIKDIRTKALKSRNPKNVVTAVFNGLKSLRNVEQVAATRGISVEAVTRA